MSEKLWQGADFDKLLDGLSNKGRKLRHDIRYACFRIQNERNGGAKAEDGHHKMAKKIEKLIGFEGWKNFAITWDVSTPNPIKIVKRKWSIFQEWNRTLEKVSIPLTEVKTDGGESNI